MPKNLLTVTHARPLIEQMIGERLHAKQVDSVTNAVVGIVQAVSLSIHAIGAGLAAVSGGASKHAIKQVDRLLSNSALNLWTLFTHWVPYVIGPTPAVVVALDWTDFDADDHATIALYLVTAHGRALPLVWRTVAKARLKGRRAEYETEVLVRLHEVLPAGVQVMVLADRGFGDQDLYAQLREFGFEFVVRFRGDITVESAQGECRPASAWVPTNGHVRCLRDARVTRDRSPSPPSSVSRSAACGTRGASPSVARSRARRPSACTAVASRSKKPSATSRTPGMASGCPPPTSATRGAVTACCCSARWP